jgi:hypothetical protein
MPAVYFGARDDAPTPRQRTHDGRQHERQHKRSGNRDEMLQIKRHIAEVLQNTAGSENPKPYSIRRNKSSPEEEEMN